MNLKKWKYIAILVLVLINSNIYSQNKQDSLSAFSLNSGSLNAAIELIDLSEHHYTRGNLTKAIVLSFDALSIVENNNSTELLFNIYINLGKIYLVLKDYEKSYYYINRAYLISLETEKHDLKINSINNLTTFYYKINEIDSASKYSNIASSKYDISNYGDNLAQTLHNQALVFKYYRKYEDAINSFKKSIEICKNENNNLLLLENFISLSETYLLLEEITKGEIYINKCLVILDNHTLLNEYKVYKVLSKIYQTKGFYKESLQNYQKYVNLKDSVLHSSLIKNVANLKTTIDLRKRINAINSLSKTNENQKAFISKQQKNKLILIAVSLIFILLIVILILLFNGKQKANKILKKQNELIRANNIEIKQKTNHLTEVNRELEKLSIAASQTDNAILITNTEGEIEWINEGYTRLYGYSLNELIQEKGKTYKQTISNTDIHSIVENVIKEKKSQIFEAKVGSKQGKTYRINTTLTPILDSNNEVIKLIAIDSDVTKLKEVEEELQKLLITKDKFFSIIAHDLKNPFNSIMGLAQLLVHGYDRLSEEKIKYYHSNLYQISKNGYELLINLLEWSRSQMGTMQFIPTEINLCSMVEETFSLYKGKAAQKEITLTNGVRKESTVHADQNMLKTILRNLVSNALKFTDRGGAVEIIENNFKEYKEITVRDTGIGIEPEDLKKLFELDKGFTTVGTEEEMGTGLGLVLCKEFIEKHTGKMRVESKVGFGSKFIFTLPVKSNI